jgi:aconitate hydratase
MGVLPLEFKTGQNAASLKLTGTESFTLLDAADALRPRGDVRVVATAADGSEVKVPGHSPHRHTEELVAFRHGGILPYVVRQLVSKS